MSQNMRLNQCRNLSRTLDVIAIDRDEKYLWQPIVERDNVIFVRCDRFLSVRRQQTDLCNEVLGQQRGAVKVDPEEPRLTELITAYLPEENVAVSLKFYRLEKSS